MSIQNIVERALKDGYLTPTMEAEVGRICESASELSLEEYMALDQLMGALLTGEVTAMPRKQFINVMEELVLSEAISRMAELESNKIHDTTVTEKKLDSPDVGDIAAYALNRLPPLYATTEEGAQYQRQHAQEELKTLICEQVEEGIQRYLERPTLPGRNPLEKIDRKDVFEKMTDLLKSLALDQESREGH
ncbi:conserved hypothetical protein [Rippkaea orientalis PCC 8801]|uniref:Late competence development protein ComFB n=1 Tax=Rippkaea orientalis (strain PCC 8801 / RF-1) TaxID=41431 RepID=B7K3B2_RIPO1|nr:late competence development ComFB family protein [Rippkaea orientalis]ACK64432.1 conserved hypothetical protein [Rippkaea orientalis PCC 8801]